MTNPTPTGLYHLQADTIDDGDRTTIIGAATAEDALQTWVAEHVVPDCVSPECIELELGWFTTLRVRAIPALTPGESLDWGADAELEDTDDVKRLAATMAQALIESRAAEAGS